MAHLLAAGYLPPVRMPGAATSALRRQVLRRAHILGQRTRLKNQVHAILAPNLVPRCPAADLSGIKGRKWLTAQDLPADEQAAAAALLRQLDFHAAEPALTEQDLAQVTLGHDDVRRLMTIPGVDATVAAARKLTVPCWQLIINSADYAFALPSLIVHKQRKLELRAGAPPAPGRTSPAARYALATVRAAERDLAARARPPTAPWPPPASPPGPTRQRAQPPTRGRDP